LLVLALVLECLPGPVNDLANFMSGKSLNELKLYPILSYLTCQAACCLELAACSFFLFLIFLANRWGWQTTQTISPYVS